MCLINYEVCYIIRIIAAFILLNVDFCTASGNKEEIPFENSVCTTFKEAKLVKRIKAIEAKVHMYKLQTIQMREAYVLTENNFKFPFKFICSSGWKVLL